MISFKRTFIVLIVLLLLSILTNYNSEVNIFCNADEYITPVGSNWTLENIITLSPETVEKIGEIYYVHENITINYGATLTIEPGTIIKFDRSISITVLGSLVAQGKESDWIICTSSADEPKVRDWNGYIFESRGEDNDNFILDYVEIKYSNYGISCRSAAPIISNSRITNCQNGIYGDSHSSPTIKNTEIMDNNFWGVRLNNAESEISNCTISGNYYGIYSDSSSLDIIDNKIDNSTIYGILLKNDNSKLIRNSITSNGQSTSGLYPGLKAENSKIILESNHFKSNTHAGLESVNSTIHLDNDVFTGNLLGINITAESVISLKNIEIYTSIEHGIKCVDSQIELINSNVTDNGWGSGGDSSKFTGVYIFNSSGYFEWNMITYNGFMGIAIEDSFAEIESNYIAFNGQDGIYCWYSSPLIKNTSVPNSTRYNLFVDKHSHPKIVNYQHSKINIFDETASITKGLTVTGFVKDLKGNPIQGATAVFLDKSKSENVFEVIERAGPSDENGNVPPVVIFYEIIYHNTTNTIVNLSQISPTEIDYGLCVKAEKEGYWGIESLIEGDGPIGTDLPLDKSPEITLTTSEEKLSGIITNPIEIEGEAEDEDSEVTGVYYRIDSEQWNSAELILPGDNNKYKWNFELDPKTTTSGKHNLQIVASDIYANSTPIELTIEVDNPEGETDADSDKLIYIDEMIYGTDPNIADTDSDGLDDGVEVDNSDGNTTDPLQSDTDGDGVLDGDEDKNHNGRVEPTETDPNNPDTDGDGVNDKEDDFPLDFTLTKREEVEEDVFYQNLIVGIIVIILILIFLIIFYLNKTKMLKKKLEQIKIEKSEEKLK